MSPGPWRPDDTGRADGPIRGRSVHRSPGSRPLALETPADRRRLIERVRIVEWMVIGLVLALILGFWHLQMVSGAHYAELATENQLRRTRVRPARGLILDRNGAVLASNHASYEIALIREAMTDEESVLVWLAEVLEVPVDVLRARLESQRSLPRFRPAVVAANVPQDRVVAIEARRREHPGVTVQVVTQRYYPYGAAAAHVLGHVGEVSPRQLDAWGDRFRMGDIVGQQGVERVYNDDLAGSAGTRLAVVNSVGREMRTLQQDPPEPGETVVLTLDIALQQRVEELFAGHRGAAVVLDVATGGILALASAPAFDPNAFAVRFSAEEWSALLRDEAKPLSNRALLASLPPGSVFKLVIATAGLEEGVIGPDTTFFCPGGKTLYGRFFACLGQHGSLDVVNALAYSCNSFFYELGVNLGRERIVKWAQRLGFGDLTGIDLPDEQPGLVPSDEWLERAGRRFYAGETVSIAIGQGLLTVSPLQAAQMAAVVATGLVREPHVLARVEESSGDHFGGRSYMPVARPAEFTERTRQLVVRGMAGSVAYGSSRRARLDTVAVGGKTGTAQVAAAGNVARNDEDRRFELRNHAWFVAVAPIDDPQVALVVFLEHGGSGGRNAAPIGGEILATYFGLPPEQVTYREIPIAPAAPRDTDVPVGEDPVDEPAAGGAAARTGTPGRGR